MSIQTESPSQELLQAWSTHAQAARENLRSIWLALDDETLIDWGTEALENCGPPLLADLDFLTEQLSATKGDSAYWACKLIGRLGSVANHAQTALGLLLAASNAPMAARQQAAHTLGMIGPLDPVTCSSLREATHSPDPRLARLAAAALEVKT